MSFNQSMLRSFLNAEGKLLLCNEPFFTCFGHCSQHLIGKSVTDVFSSFDCMEVLQAVKCCHQNPEQSFTVIMEKSTCEGHACFCWQIYAEQNGGRVTGIHLIGEPMKAEKAA